MFLSPWCCQASSSPPPSPLDIREVVAKRVRRQLRGRSRQRRWNVKSREEWGNYGAGCMCGGDGGGAAVTETTTGRVLLPLGGLFCRQQLCFQPLISNCESFNSEFEVWTQNLGPGEMRLINERKNKDASSWHCPFLTSEVEKPVWGQ